MTDNPWYYFNKKRATAFICVCVGMALTLVNCAKQGGGPDGGPMDSLPPLFIKATPPNFTTNFDGDEIRIYFDEFVKLKDLRKQLIISPPIINRIISPQGSASKYIKIAIQDTLAANTTYVFNFGLSIVDNNEGNPFPSFKYVMSTGDYIDSLKVTGTIIDAVEEKPDNFVTVMLYEADSTYTDSTVYKNPPLYVTNTLDSVNTFELDYLKPGTYALIGLKDEDANFTFQPNKDKIAFVEEFITVPTDSSYTLKLFSEAPAYKVSRPKHAAEGRIAFGITGYRDSININLLTDTGKNHTATITEKGDDTLYYWYKPRLEIDSLIFNVTAPAFSDTLQARIRKPKLDSLAFSSTYRNSVLLNKPYRILSNIPLDSINENLITVLRDSVAIPFTYALAENKTALDLDFKRDEKTIYNITVLPEAVTDFFGQKNDTLVYKAKTKEIADYGDIELTLVNAVNFPFIVQLLDSKGTLIDEQYSTAETVFNFELLNPGNYKIRLIEDANNNRVFDSGDYLTKRQPEIIINYPGQIEVSPSWFAKETFELLPKKATQKTSDTIEE